MRYTEFTDQILTALYLQSELKSGNMFTFRSLAEHYGIRYLPSWLVDGQHELRDRGLLQGPGNSRNDDQAAGRITGAGRRYVEELLEESGDAQGWVLAYRMIDEHEEASSAQSETPDLREVDEAIARIAPAADRLVSITDNQSKIEQINSQIHIIDQTVAASNELDPDEKSDVLASLGAAQSLLQGSKSFLIGAFRYLVLERVKKAFEKTIEDAFRVIIITALLAIVAILVTMI